MVTLFCFCATVVLYVYIGYPLVLRTEILAIKREPRHESLELPSLSVIVPAHNEESSIRAKIENLLASDYPRDRIEILVGSDGSSDGTEQLVRQYANDGVGLVSFPQQHGKSAIQNSLVALTSGNVLVFTDADCLFRPDSLRALIANFADSKIGLVTARPLFINVNATNVTHNEGIYLRYETWLREQESARGLLAMASGSLFAVRRELWRPVDKTMGDDFALPLYVARSRFRNVLEPRAVATTTLTQDKASGMFRMKVRIIAKDLRALLANRELLNPIRFPGISIALWSHKLLRWLVPYFLVALSASNLASLRFPLFTEFFWLQIAFYGMAFIGVITKSRSLLLSIPASFCIVNAAALIGTLSCFFGRTFSHWTPTRNTQSVFESRGARS